jgi:hypothetical protein
MKVTFIKIWEKKKPRGCEERLANNKTALSPIIKLIPAEDDTRWSALNQSRYLAGAA